MQDDLDIEANPEEPLDIEAGTLYKVAEEEMQRLIPTYLRLAKETKGFNDVTKEQVVGPDEKLIVLAGIGSKLTPDDSSSEQVVQERLRASAVPFDVETAITRGVYIKLRARAADWVRELAAATADFTKFTTDYICANPHMLPFLQRLASISNKAELKKQIGNVSDNSVSKVSAAKLVALLQARSSTRRMTAAEVIQSIEPTLEGIVRDLVGKILLETVVANALDQAQVRYLREGQYKHLMGVVYSFRADFVVPNADEPKAFIEVRKSSSRHASLYAKDKMFSAINWKGRNKELLAVLVAEGPWTAETLRVLANVFDYVVPLSRSLEVAEAIAAYSKGDRSKLKWIIEFKITAANTTSAS